MSIPAIVAWVVANWATILGILAALYGFLTAVVKLVPTLNEGWLLAIIQFLGKITNRQTNDAAIRAARKAAIKK